MSSSEDRPFPPGDYPVVVVGTGPGGLQTSYCLRRFGIRHALISADSAPGGMFRRWPFFQRLLSWTKPYAPAVRRSRAYERYDWNSLIPDLDEHRAIVPEFMDGSSYFPSRPEMEQGLVAFAERTGIVARYGCRWTGTRRESGPAGDRFVVETTDGEYRAEIAIFAVGVAEPWRPSTPGLELAAHYADTRPVETYADRRVFIVGKQNSGFELATGMLPWARQIIVVSPSPAKLSVNTHSLVGIRARYVQPYEDHVLGGGVAILDASIESVERTGHGFRVRTRPTAGGSDRLFDVDEVIAATGFVAPLLDLPALGVATFGQSRLPAQTPFWESATVPGIHFAGTIGQGSAGLKKHGIPSNSGAVQGARYNARTLVERLATVRFGIEPQRPSIAPGDLLPFLLGELTRGPEVWHQRSYLCRVVGVDGDRGITDDGIVPLAHFLDAGGGDAIAVTLESDGTGAVYPALYLRLDGRTEEHLLEPHPLLDYEGREYRKALAAILGRLVPSYKSVYSQAS
ncbi:MAG TPA: NAD(P)-binding domain-containing protein [Candidatus Limnocylindrales bacterium]